MTDTLPELFDDQQDIQEAAISLESSQSMDEHLEQVFKVFDLFGVGHGCLHALNETYSPSQALWRVTPPDVTSACSYLIETNKHPAVRLGKTRHFAFDLFDFRDNFEGDPDVDALYEAFEQNGVAQAYGLPIQTKDRGTFVFVVARPGAPIDTVELLTLQAICSNAVNGVMQFVPRPCEQGMAGKFSGDEKRILTGIAHGKDMADIADEAAVSELALRSKVDHIVKKAGARNISHAVVLSLIEGEISLEELSPT
ncbi:MAG: hypothetical protein HRU27_16015 [Rhizobiaceae bacterium]|nr:hypothetical protein [Rhizobiaceae bacterium]